MYHKARQTPMYHCEVDKDKILRAPVPAKD